MVRYIILAVIILFIIDILLYGIFYSQLKHHFCEHHNIRYWSQEVETIIDRKYRVYNFSCDDCGKNFVIRKRIK